VFAIIGWQTILYRPDFVGRDWHHLTIVDETNRHLSRPEAYRPGHSHPQILSQPAVQWKSLSSLIQSFGILTSEWTPQCMTVSSSSFNTDLLTKVANIKIQWMDCLFRHMDFNSTTNTLYLLRYPSFCIIHLQYRQQHLNFTSLHTCASNNSSRGTWLTKEDVDVMMTEILQSYGLLFGQDNKSRQLFRTLRPFEGIPKECIDPVLEGLCGQEDYHVEGLPPQVNNYLLHQDIVIFDARIAQLVEHLSSKRVRSWRDLWKDKRDSAAWHTFWAVIIVGAIRVFLAFVQVVLQVVQLSLQTTRASRP
jgi:hypothetical protein